MSFREEKRAIEDWRTKPRVSILSGHENAPSQQRGLSYHSEAMLLPYAQKVREAEISEFNSHVVNGTFGPELEEREFASGPPLKAVWVYSKSKKDPDGYKARVVMQGFLMKQGLHFNDVHASCAGSSIVSCLHGRGREQGPEPGTLGR